MLICKKSCLVLLLLLSITSKRNDAQNSLYNPATTWWPDPQTGLMWTGTSYAPGSFWKIKPLNWNEANEYCTTLKLGGYTDWRLPTLDDASTMTYNEHNVVTVYSEATGGYHHCDTNISHQCPDELVFDTAPHDVAHIKGIQQDLQRAYVWSATPVAGHPELMWMFFSVGGPIPTSNLAMTNGKVDRTANTLPMLTLCVRNMEPDVLELAKQAQVIVPVRDTAMLKAYVTLNNARLAYKKGDYQQSLGLSQAALKDEPGLQEALWGVGISSGMLGNWDQAVQSLTGASKIGGDPFGISNALQWAKQVGPPPRRASNRR